MFMFMFMFFCFFSLKLYCFQILKYQLESVIKN